ncbi:putative NipSnap protein isoform 1 [Schistosoma japonicum]|nr:putative NipSnap protein isoform 1 [Schistosoma japonicum]
MDKVASSVLRMCETFLFDCDGVVWNSNILVPSSQTLIQYLLDCKKHVFLITNNSRRSVKDYVSKCHGLGLPISEKNIICSARVAAHFLRDKISDGEVYVVGESGLSTELREAGVSHFGVGPDLPVDPSNPLQDVKLKSNVKAVLVGFDCHFNYRKLMQGTAYIVNGASFYATNEDAQLPGGNIIFPGTGSIVSAFKVASGKEPIVFGKPHKPMFDLLCKYCNLDPSKTIMVGDNLYTDIAFGNKFGLHTACVLTGVTNQALIDKVNQSPDDVLFRPKYIFQSVADILNILKG